MFLNYKFDYPESLDYTRLPGYERLSSKQQQRIHEAYEQAYHSVKHLGIKIATGRAHETAKLALSSELKSPTPVSEIPMIPSIFSGLDNCQ